MGYISFLFDFSLEIEPAMTSVTVVLCTTKTSLEAVDRCNDRRRRLHIVDHQATKIDTFFPIPTQHSPCSPRTKKYTDSVKSLWAIHFVRIPLASSLHPPFYLTLPPSSSCHPSFRPPHRRVTKPTWQPAKIPSPVALVRIAKPRTISNMHIV